MATNEKRNYRVDFSTMTLTMTAEFAERAYNPNTDEYIILSRLQQDFPKLRVRRKTHRSPKTSNPNKGLNYQRMERYIRLHENGDELMEQFEKVKAIASTQKNAYLFTSTWFHRQFPNFTKLPDFQKGKMYAFPVSAVEPQEEGAA